jgi:hypothetical protein
MTPPAQPPERDGAGSTGPDDETTPIPVGPPLAPEPARERRRIDRWAAPPPNARPYRNSFIGMIGLAMALFIILASGAMLPWYAIAALTVVWLAALVRGAQWFVSRPNRVLLLPLLVLGLWLAVLMAGVALFGWGT